MKEKAIQAAMQAFETESASILETAKTIDPAQLAKAAEVLSKAERIASTGCGHSGIAARHFAHLMCCVERPARFLSPAEAVHGGVGFLKKGDVLVWTSRGGKTDRLDLYQYMLGNSKNVQFDLQNNDILFVPVANNIVRIEEYGGETFAILRPEEDRSAKHYIAATTLNGGMKVNIWDRNNPRLEADYVWVNFSLPMAQPMLDGTVHIVGALTDWRVDSLSQMDYNPQYRAYTKRLLLKQGYYAYQLLVHSPARRGASATARLEGDHREAPNHYTVYVYQHSPADRADRLIAVRRVAYQ